MRGKEEERKEKGRETALVENQAKEEEKKKKVRYVEQAGCRGLIFACGKVQSHNKDGDGEDYLFLSQAEVT